MSSEVRRIEQEIGVRFTGKWNNHNPGLRTSVRVNSGGKVTGLSLQDVRLRAFPESVLALKHLASLYLYMNGLTSVPAEIAHLGKLRRLYLHHNPIGSLPPQLFELTRLDTLVLNSDGLREIPSEIAKLSNLRKLNLNHNPLLGLPPEIVNLTHLEELSLGGQVWSDVPEEVWKLSTLKRLHLHSSPNLRRLPPEFVNLKNLTYLSIRNTSLVHPPVEIVEGAIEGIRNYFIELDAQGEDFVYEAKLLLVGEPGAGKTTLAEKLINPSYPLNPTEPMTKGIEVREWHFDYDPSHRFQANLWDFGGQEIMHATHRYFLTKRSLYVVLADNRKEDTDFYYWLSLIQLLGGDSPVVIVLNEKFSHKKYVPREILEAFPCVKQICNVNLADNTGLADLTRDLQRRLKDLPHVGREPIPRRWLKVREQLAIEKRAHDHISRRRYLELCASERIDDESKALFISDFLHDLGTLLHFQADRVLRNTMVLSTHWVTEAVYLILFDETVIKAGGRFGPADMDRIWSVPQYCDHHGELLRLMVNFEICYPMEGTSDHIVPELLPEQVPCGDYPDFHRARGEVLRFEYRYDFMPKGLVSRLIVRLHRHVHRGLQWRGGVVLAIDGAQVELVEQRQSRVLRIAIVGKDKLGALAVVRHQVEALHRSFEKLAAAEMIPCNCGECAKSSMPHFFDYALLRRYGAKHIAEIRCEASLDNVSVAALVEDLILPERRGDGASTGVGATRAHVRTGIFISYAHADRAWLGRIKIHLRALELEGAQIDAWDDSRIKAGDRWRDEIAKALKRAEIAILVVTTDFLASEFIASDELPPLLHAAEREGTRILPLIVKSSRFSRDKRLNGFHAVNDPKRPLATLTEDEQDQVLLDLIDTIEDHLQRGTALG